MNKGQGSMEYLFLVGGAALVVVIVIFIVFNLESNTETQVGGTFDVFKDVIDGLTGRVAQTATFCGDGTVQNPNDNGEAEQCDPPGTLGSPIACNTVIPGAFGSISECKTDCTYDVGTCFLP